MNNLRVYLHILCAFVSPVITALFAFGGLFLNVYWVHGLVIGGAIASLTILGLFWRYRANLNELTAVSKLVITSVNLAWVLPVMFLIGRTYKFEADYVVLTYALAAFVVLATWVVSTYRFIRDSLRTRVFGIGVTTGFVLASVSLVINMAFGMFVVRTLMDFPYKRNVDWLIDLAGVNIKIPEQYFLRLALRDVYLWSDELPDQIPLNPNRKLMLDANKSKKDSWSYIENFGDFLDDEANVRNKFGFFITRDADGAYRVSRVIPNSSAFKSGLQRGDLIVAVNDHAPTGWPIKQINKTDSTLRLKLLSESPLMQ